MNNDIMGSTVVDCTQLDEEERTIVRAAQDGPLSDVIIAGFLDETANRKRFHPMVKTVYLQFGESLLRLSSVEKYASLAIHLVDEVSCDFDIDEDDDFCACSAVTLFLRAPFADSRVERIELFHEKMTQGTGTILKAVGLYLERNEYIFVDPTNYFGIQLGGMDHRNRWIDEYRPTQIACVLIAQMDPKGGEMQR